MIATTSICRFYGPSKPVAIGVPFLLICAAMVAFWNFYEISPVITGSAESPSEREGELARKLEQLMSQHEALIGERDKLAAERDALLAERPANRLAESPNLSIADNPPGTLSTCNSREDRMKSQSPAGARVGYFILSHSNSVNKAHAVQRTWASRVALHRFAIESDSEWAFASSGLPTSTVPNVQPGSNNLGYKVFGLLRYAHETFPDLDWYIVADDDTYIVERNIDALLANYDPATPYYIGAEFNHVPEALFINGGSGIVLSRAAVGRMYDGGQPGSGIGVCQTPFFTAGDTSVGHCMKQLGIPTTNAPGFYYGNVPAMLVNPMSIASWCAAFWHPKDHCPPGRKPYSFHYLTPDEMDEYDYLLYKACVATT